MPDLPRHAQTNSLAGFARRRACASYRNAADNADLKNYAATHRSSLSRGTAGELEKGPTGRTGCICLVLSDRGCRVHASFTLVETNGGRNMGWKLKKGENFFEFSSNLTRLAHIFDCVLYIFEISLARDNMFLLIDRDNVEYRWWKLL